MNNAERTPGSGVVPMAAGMGIGAVAGFAIRMTTGLFDLFPAFLGVRFVLGMVLKKADDRRDKA